MTEKKILLVMAVLFTIVSTACSSESDQGVQKHINLPVIDSGSSVAANPIYIEMNKDPFPAELADVRGFSSPESWGRWTDGKNVIMTFNRPLPHKFDLQFMIYGTFGANANQPIQVKIGSAVENFIVSTANQTVTIPFFMTSNATVLELSIPAPASPKSLGTSEDTRQLGIAITKISILPK